MQAALDQGPYSERLRPFTCAVQELEGNRERNPNGSSMSNSGDNFPSGEEDQQRGKKRVMREEFNVLPDETHYIFNIVAGMQ